MEMCKVILFTVLEIILVHFTQFSKSSQDMDNWRVHQKRIHSFPCGEPQPRSFRLEDIVEDKNDLPDVNVEVFPKMTVLHRCDSQSGCCNHSNKVCAPKETDDVSLTFRIINRINKRHAGGAKDRYLHVVASNHTNCACQIEHDLPK